MGNLNRTCYVCGKRYSYCPSCYEDRHLENWHIMFHDENCKNIFSILADNFNKHIDDKEAYEKLKDCDLSNSDLFYENIKKDLDRVLATNKVEKVGKKYEKKNLSNMQKRV